MKTECQEGRITFMARSASSRASFKRSVLMFSLNIGRFGEESAARTAFDDDFGGDFERCVGDIRREGRVRVTVVADDAAGGGGGNGAGAGGAGAQTVAGAERLGMVRVGRGSDIVVVMPGFLGIGDW